MAERADLDAAAQAGVISAAQAEALEAFLKSRIAVAAQAPRTAGPAGEEELRFIRNFHDVFLAMGIAILAVGIAVGIVTAIAGKDSAADVAAIGCVLAAMLFWGLGEVFSRRRRLFLPSIAICVAFVGYVGAMAVSLYVWGVLAPLNAGQGLTPVEAAHRGALLARIGFAVVAFSGVAAASAFYWRFRLPFSLGVLGLMAALFLNSIYSAAAPEWAVQTQSAVWLIAGLALFACGVAFDIRDPTRQTRLSDNGFWLHFAAAPLILAGVFGLIGMAFAGGPQTTPALQGNDGPFYIGPSRYQSSAPQAIVTLISVALLGLVSLLINRRALIVSALLTTGVAIGVLMNATGLGEGALVAGTLITLGGFVLILGAGWQSVRQAMLRRIKPRGIWARIFPQEDNEEGQRT
ncbi:MAG: hypothetical protein AB7O04_08035 [Hyphomonadaceae bacterium]